MVAMATTSADGGTANANPTALAVYILYFFAQLQLTCCFSAFKITGLDIQSGCHRLETIKLNHSINNTCMII